MKTKEELTKIRKKAKVDGKTFERKVREDLENKEWIVDRWTNNVEISTDNKIGKLVPCKPKWNNFTHNLMMNSGGIPDFIVYKLSDGVSLPKIEGRLLPEKMFQEYEIIGVECKVDGYSTQEYKEKYKWLLKNNIFSKILIAKKGEKRGEIIYDEFKEN